MIEEELQANGLELLGLCHGLAQNDAALLQSSALLDHFTNDEAETLGGVMLHVRAQPGQILIQEDTTGDWMMLLLRGTVDVTKRSARGEPSRLAVIKSGASVGEMSMLDCEPRYATCSALEEVEFGVLSRLAIGQLILFRIGLHPAFAVGERHETSFTKWPVRKNPAGNAHSRRLMLELLGGLQSKLADQLSNRMSVAVRSGVGVVPKLPDLVQFLNADRFEFFH